VISLWSEQWRNVGSIPNSNETFCEYSGGQGRAAEDFVLTEHEVASLGNGVQTLRLIILPPSSEIP